MYDGLDVHKRSWNAAIYLGEQYIRNINQPPAPQALHQFLQHSYPQANYVCAYEYGKFGYYHQTLYVPTAIKASTHRIRVMDNKNCISSLKKLV